MFGARSCPDASRDRLPRLGRLNLRTGRTWVPLTTVPSRQCPHDKETCDHVEVGRSFQASRVAVGKDQLVDKIRDLVKGELGRQERVEKSRLVDRVSLVLEDARDGQELYIDLCPVEPRTLLRDEADEAGDYLTAIDVAWQFDARIGRQVGNERARINDIAHEPKGLMAFLGGNNLGAYSVLGGSRRSEVSPVRALRSASKSSSSLSSLYKYSGREPHAFRYPRHGEETRGNTRHCERSIR